MGQQLALYQGLPAVPPTPVARASSGTAVRLCAGCRAGEARYGFRDDDNLDPTLERPRTLCFGCFRMEINRRQAVAARLARGWNGTQVTLPLHETLERLNRRRRRAQIAARHALEAATEAAS
jgi:hypothetical protein